MELELRPSAKNRQNYLTSDILITVCRMPVDATYIQPVNFTILRFVVGHSLSQALSAWNSVPESFRYPALSSSSLRELLNRDIDLEGRGQVPLTNMVRRVHQYRCQSKFLSVMST